MEWISTSERMPEDGALVIAVGHLENDVTQRQWIAIVTYEEGVFYDPDTGDDFYPPTHWMRTPELPGASSHD